MKNIIRFSFVFGLILTIVCLPREGSAGINQWSSSGLNGKSITALAINPTTPTTVYAGVGGQGVFKSVNGGASWAATGLVGKITTSTLAIDPITTSTIYAGTLIRGVFKSVDGGISWTAMNAGLHNFNIRVIAIDPITPSTVYSGNFMGGGLNKSVDGGANWSGTGVFFNAINSLVIDPVTPTNIYAGTNEGRFLKSVDGGANWATTSLPLSAAGWVPYIQSLAIDPVTPTTIYAGTDVAGIFKSVDSGASWTSVFSANYSVMAIDPATHTTIYGGSFRSVDGGANWASFKVGMPQSVAVQNLAIDPITPTTIYAGTNDGVYKFQTSPSTSTVTLSLNSSAFATGNGLILTRKTVASVPPTMADIYLALQLPDGSLFVMQPNGSFGQALVPFLSNVQVPDFTGVVFNYTFTGIEPVGTYSWFAALAQPGTLNVIGSITQASFTFSP